MPSVKLTDVLYDTSLFPRPTFEILNCVRNHSRILQNVSNSLCGVLLPQERCVLLRRRGWKEVQFVNETLNDNILYCDWHHFTDLDYFTSLQRHYWISLKRYYLVSVPGAYSYDCFGYYFRRGYYTEIRLLRRPKVCTLRIRVMSVANLNL